MDQTSMTLLQGLLISCLDGKLSTALHIGLHRLMDPLTRGDFPSSMRTIVKNRLPEFTKNQSEMSKASFDFTGINYSTTLYPFDDAKPNFHAVRTGVFGYRSFRNKLHDNTEDSCPVILLASLATGLRENSSSMQRPSTTIQSYTSLRMLSWMDSSSFVFHWCHVTSACPSSGYVGV
ncbi:unnamed protein product, partial [Musa hybrid cultivar]